MATIITVHGTFAHRDGEVPADARLGEAAQWWQRHGPTERELRQRLQCETGDISIEPFIWDGNNSELSRRRAGKQLFARLKQLERQRHEYYLVGHSHGGSVISVALLEAAKRHNRLQGLQRWITVGTPFLRFERGGKLMFFNLFLWERAMLVASLILLIVTISSLIGDLLSGVNFNNERVVWRMGVAAALALVPIVIVTVFLRFLVGRRAGSFSGGTVRRARNEFSDRWLGLYHEDDEAIASLGAINRVKVPIFRRQFALPLFSLVAVFGLPLAYFMIIASPPAMVALAEFGRDRLYQLATHEHRAKAFRKALRIVRSLSRDVRDKRTSLGFAQISSSDRESLKNDLKELEAKLTDARVALRQAFPDGASLQRAMRFKRKFLERHGKPCDASNLCDAGENMSLNGKLVSHFVLDDWASVIANKEPASGWIDKVWRFLAPLVLVPVIIGLMSLLFLVLIQVIATPASYFMSRSLDKWSWLKIRSMALGDDSLTEVAVGADTAPAWVGGACAPLPAIIAGRITEHSNEIAFASIANFRNAISELASPEAGADDHDAFSYLTWKELVHSAYFDVAEFQWLLAEAIAEAGSVSRSDAFDRSSESQAAAGWLSEVAGRAKSA